MSDPANERERAAFAASVSACEAGWIDFELDAGAKGAGVSFSDAMAIEPPDALASRMRFTLKHDEYVEQVIPAARVCVFGSRATGRARPFSDLDLLVVQPARSSWQQRADLRDRFEASDLPFRVDIVEADGLPSGMAEGMASESISLRDL